MGYKIIKPSRGGTLSTPSICVSKHRIYFTKALVQQLDLQRNRYVLLYKNTYTNTLSFDFKDVPMPDAFYIAQHTNKGNSKMYCIYASKTIELLGIEYGKYHITKQEGSMFETDIKINEEI